MKKEDFESAIQRMRSDSPKRKFKQSVELIVALKGLNLKKPEEQVDAFVSLPHNRGKPIKVAAFVGAELIDSARKSCTQAVLDEEFRLFENDKKKIKKLADENDYFLGQAALMPQIAKVFGRILGPKGKMPNPKAGCVVPPNANLLSVVERLQKTVRIQARTAPVAQAVIGSEDLPDSSLLDNAMAVYTNLVHALPGEENNVRKVILKFSMGPVIRVGASETQTSKPAQKSAVKPAKEVIVEETPKKKPSKKEEDGE